MSISLPFGSPNASNTEYISFNDAFEKGSPVDRRKAEKLLANIHRGLYNDTFPIPSEQESLEYWLGNLKSGRENGQQSAAISTRPTRKSWVLSAAGYWQTAIAG